MLWSIILPLQITACFWLLFIGIVWFLTRRRRQRWPYMALAVCASALMFIPSLVGIARAVDHFRFGVFHYHDFTAINDWRVERYLPPAATDITIE